MVSLPEKHWIMATLADPQIHLQANLDMSLLDSELTAQELKQQVVEFFLFQSLNLSYRIYS